MKHLPFSGLLAVLLLGSFHLPQGTLAPGGTTPSGPMHLSSGSACAAEWSPTAGGAPYFATGSPHLPGSVFAMTVFDDGSGPALFVGGSFAFAGGVAARRIARWDGSRWSALGSGIAGPFTVSAVRALAVFDDGRGPALYAGGLFADAGGVPAANIARWDGVAWEPLAAGLGGGMSYEAVHSLCVYDDGSGPALYAGGLFSAAGTTQVNHLARWDGQSWTPLDTGVNQRVHALCVYDDGSGAALYAGGRFTAAGGLSAAHIARWDGASWSALGLGTNGWVQALTVLDEGTGAALYAGGLFESAGAVAASRVARWDGQDWTPMGSGLGGEVRTLFVSDDGAGGGPTLHAGGHILFGAWWAPHHVARWDGASWSALPGTLEATVHALGAFDDGSGAGPRLHVGKGRGVMRWEGSDWGSLEDGLDADVHAVAVFDDGSGPAVHLGGDFLQAGTLQTKRIAKWDGTSWSPLGGGVDGAGFSRVSALAVHDDGSGPALFAGGNFVSVDGVPGTSRIARWSGTSWSALDQGPPLTFVRALKEHDDGSGLALYVGGDGGIQRWDGQGWSPVGAGVGASVSIDPPVVRALEVFDTGSGPALFAAVTFYGPLGANLYRIERWNGQTWSSVSGNIEYGTIRALVAFDDGSGPMLYMSGTFATVQGSAIRGVARWNGFGWGPVGDEELYGVATLAVHDDWTGSALYAGGEFPDRILRWNGSSWIAFDDIPNDAIHVLRSIEVVPGEGSALWVGGAFRASPAEDSFLTRLQGCAAPPGEVFCAGDGSGTPCPCWNEGASGQGCTNSTGQGALLGGSGSSGVAAADLALGGEHLPAGVFGVFFQGTSRVNGGAGTHFGDGLRCAGGAVVRLEVAASDASGRATTSIDLAAKGSVSAGDIRTYQLWYRDPAGSACGAGFNLSNGFEVAWVP